MGKTAAEKILSRHSGRDARAGDIVIADVDLMMFHDGNRPLVSDVFAELKAEKPAHPDRITVVIDHFAPSANEFTSQMHQKLRDFCRRFNVRLYEVGDGICHQLIPQEGLVCPGDLVIGADSHTPAYGALNVLSAGVGASDLAVAMASGKMWFVVPETLRFIVRGHLPAGTDSKDLAHFLTGQVGANGANYMIVEFVGEAVRELSIEGRLTLANLSTEMGAKAALMEADEKTAEWLSTRTSKVFQATVSDVDAEFAAVKEYDISNLSPQVAIPHRVDNVVPVTQVKGTPVQAAILGTCTSGRLEDLHLAAAVLEGHRVASGTRLSVIPASRRVYLEAVRDGTIEKLLRAGATILPSTCGPCLGVSMGIPSDGEYVISTANRNYMGRMGNNKAYIYLASAATVAASAVEGAIADPRPYIGAKAGSFVGRPERDKLRAGQSSPACTGG